MTNICHTFAMEHNPLKYMYWTNYWQLLLYICNGEKQFVHICHYKGFSTRKSEREYTIAFQKRIGKYLSLVQSGWGP